jgi:hypothetical protein
MILTKCKTKLIKPNLKKSIIRCNKSTNVIPSCYYSPTEVNVFSSTTIVCLFYDQFDKVYVILASTKNKINNQWIRENNKSLIKYKKVRIKKARIGVRIGNTIGKTISCYELPNKLTFKLSFEKYIQKNLLDV